MVFVESDKKKPQAEFESATSSSLCSSNVPRTRYTRLSH